MSAIPAPTDLKAYRGSVGQIFAFLVTGNSSGTIYGTGIYTDDSVLAVAAVHSGFVALKATRTITVITLPGQNAYTGSTQNGISSYSWDTGVTLM